MLTRDEEFFRLFVNFRGYVDFFLLNDLVSDDYKKVKLFLGADVGMFNRNPLPQNKQEWEQLLDNQMRFLEKRNKRIKRFCCK